MARAAGILPESSDSYDFLYDFRIFYTAFNNSMIPYYSSASNIAFERNELNHDRQVDKPTPKRELGEGSFG